MGDRLAAPRRCIILWGPTNVGKSSWVWRNFPNLYNALLPDDNSGKLWLERYDGQRCVLFDDFYGEMSLSFLLRICDQWAMQVSCKGGSYPWLADYVFFTSNVHPADWWPGRGYSAERLAALWRRVEIRHITARTFELQQAELPPLPAPLPGSADQGRAPSSEAGAGGLSANLAGPLRSGRNDH